jgi:hypothetical protein
MTPEQEREYIEQLREQVERNDAHTENECAKLLKDLAWALLPAFDGTITFVNCEQSCSTGRVDMIVIAEVSALGGEIHKGAYLWELKAPQLPLFVIETQNQACPTPDLFKAENQLLHYHHAMANDGHWRTRWDIASPDYVKFGGIVMGRDNTFVECRACDPVLSRRLASQAIDIRQSVFYRSFNISILTWDRVLTILANQTLSHRKIMGDVTTKIDLKATSTSTIGIAPLV